MDKNKQIFLTVIIILVLAILATVFLRKSGSPSVDGKYDSLAICLKDKGAIFYGAFWCPHCQATKKLFGSSAKLLPYVECSTADGNGQTQICKDKKIMGYPTWEFKDGSRLTGEIPLSQLAEKTSCSLPQ